MGAILMFSEVPNPGIAHQQGESNVWDCPPTGNPNIWDYPPTGNPNCPATGNPNVWDCSQD